MNQAPIIMPTILATDSLDHRQADRRKAELADGVQEVGKEQPEQRHLEVHGDEGLRSPHQQQEAGADQDEAEGELQGHAGVQAAFGQQNPQRRHDGTEDHDHAGVEGLGLGRVEPARHLGGLVSEQGQRGAGLLEQGPEQNREHGQNDRRQHLPAVVAPQEGEGIQQQAGEHRRHEIQQRRLDRVVLLHDQPGRDDEQDAEDVDPGFPRDAQGLLVQLGAGGRIGASAKPLLAQPEGDQTGQHADAGQAEAVAPPVFDAQPAAQGGSKDRAQIDADIEDGEARVAARIVLLVERAHHRRNVGFQEAHADDDQGQGQEQDGFAQGLVALGLQRIGAGGGEGGEAGGGGRLRRGLSRGIQRAGRRRAQARPHSGCSRVGGVGG
ncbi:MAG: hypothetical protein U1C74_30850 [Phenylobacterium sp.]|nr:hypothetical protein [Phenylobacterium sp.]